jgi:hypothetical protein
LNGLRAGFGGELLESSVLESRNAGSFDCVVARFADDHFAQDDKQLAMTKVGGDKSWSLTKLLIDKAGDDRAGHA